MDKVVFNKFPQYKLSPLYHSEFCYLDRSDFENYRPAMRPFFDANITLAREIPIWTLFNEDPTHPGGFDIWMNVPPGHVITEKSEQSATKTSDHDIDGNLLIPSGEKIIWRARLFKDGRRELKLDDGFKISAEFGPVFDVREQLERMERGLNENIKQVAEKQQEDGRTIVTIVHEQQEQEQHIEKLTDNVDRLVSSVREVRAETTHLASEMTHLAVVEKLSLIVATIGLVTGVSGILIALLPSILATLRQIFTVTR
jgi:hypothetical protein